MDFDTGEGADVENPGEQPVGSSYVPPSQPTAAPAASAADPVVVAPVVAEEDDSLAPPPESLPADEDNPGTDPEKGDASGEINELD